MVTELAKLFARDLDRLHNEIVAFGQEDHLWQTSSGVKNAAGNLGLHLVGNLSAYIGHTLGHHRYERNREAEFATRHMPRQELLAKITATREVVLDSLRRLTPEDLSKAYPEEVLGYPMTTGYFLVHLLAHLSYHLGQVNYLRRILEGVATDH
jgi:uncharacterized damage-inducible protein DinB